MKEKLTNNIKRKILSVILAFISWVLIMNVSNPRVTRTKNVEVGIVNENIILDAGQTYNILGGKNIMLSYVVRMRDEHKIKSSDFKAYIDLGDLYGVTGAVPVSVEVVSNRDRIIGIPIAKPTVMKIATEDIQKKEFDIETKTLGKPATGLNVGSVKVKPNTLFVSGPVSLIGQISSVGIEIDVSGAKENIKGVIEPIYYDANGNVINFDKNTVYTNLDGVEYEVVLLKGKTLALNFNVGGEPAEGHIFTGAKSETKSISVLGLKEDLEKIDKIEIPKELLNIDGAIEDKIITFDIRTYLPPTILTEGETMVSVLLNIESLHKNLYEIEFDDIKKIGMKKEYTYKIMPEKISVVISGMSVDLDDFRSDMLNAKIDCTKLTKGKYIGELKFELPQGYSIESYTPFEIEVVDKINTIEEKDDDKLEESEIISERISDIEENEIEKNKIEKNKIEKHKVEENELSQDSKLESN